MRYLESSLMRPESLSGSTGGRARVQTVNVLGTPLALTDYTRRSTGWTR